MLKSFIKSTGIVCLVLLVLISGYFIFEKFRTPRLSNLKDAFTIIQPQLSELEQTITYEQERAWIMCGIDTGPEPCPSYSARYKIDRLGVVDKFNEVSTILKNNKWEEVKYPDSEKLCTLLRDNVDQFKEGIFGTVCERDFYKDDIKLKMYSAWLNKQEGPDKLSLNFRFIDSRHAR